MRPKFDAVDAELLTEREKARATIKGPEVGDYVITDQGAKRIAYVWPNGRYQLTSGGSFYFDQSGLMSYSGGLETALELDLVPADNAERTAAAWFFHHDWATGHNGVNVSTPVRQWTIRPAQAHRYGWRHV